MCHSSLIKLKMPFFIRIKTQKDSNLDVTCQNPLYKQCPQLREKNRNSQPEFQEEDFETPRSTT